MNLVESLAIATALSIDTFSVSLSKGLTFRDSRFKLFLLPFVFAIVQGSLSFLGWWLGKAVVLILQEYAHYLGFVLLVVLGFKMLFEEPEPEKFEWYNSFKITLIQAFATSIDALFVSFSLATAENAKILEFSILVAVMTYLFSLLGFTVGRTITQIIKKLNPFILGGLILIILGFKILVEGS